MQRPVGRSLLVISRNHRDQCSESGVRSWKRGRGGAAESSRSKVGQGRELALYSTYHGRLLEGLKQGCDII